VPDDAPRISRPGRIEELPVLVDHVREACARAGADHATAFEVRLAVEEVCMNLIRYGYADRDPGPIEIGVRAEPRGLVVTIVDFSPPFAPEDAPVPDLSSDAEHRTPGGLGWYLVKRVVDEIRYEPGGAKGNRLTLVKYFKGGEAKEDVHGDHGARIGSADGRGDPRKR
jgi:serine/threonine-protein kinase RsbW